MSKAAIDLENNTPLILMSVGLVVGVLTLILVMHLSRKMNYALGGISSILYYEQKELDSSGDAGDCPTTCQLDDRGNCTRLGHPCDMSGSGQASVPLDTTVPLTQKECTGRCAWDETTRGCTDLQGYPCMKPGPAPLHYSVAAEDTHGFRQHNRLARS